MGTDVFALIAEWPPMVDAYREAGGFAFYWDANVRQNDMLYAAQQAGRRVDWEALPELLPYAWEHPVPGRGGYLSVPAYLADLREHLPARVRDPLEALVCALYAEESPGCDDLVADSGAPGDPSVLYALRPSSVRAVLERFAAVPWDALSDLGERVELPRWTDDRYLSNRSAFEVVLWQQRGWLEAAAEQERGVVTVVSR